MTTVFMSKANFILFQFGVFIYSFYFIVLTRASIDVEYR